MNEKFFLSQIQKLIKKYIYEHKNFEPLSKSIIEKRATDFYERAFFFDKTDRLMPKAKKAIIEYDKKQKSFPYSTIWIAPTLNLAKGRMERKWFAPEGGLYLCITLFKSLLDRYQNLSSLVVPVAICETLLEYGFYSEIRWLNDVLINGKKVAGTLSEAIITKNLKEEYLLFGIGINVNIKNFPNFLKNKATSLYLEKGVTLEIQKLSAVLLAKIAILFSMVQEWESLTLKDIELENVLIKKYRKFSKLENRRVFYGLDLEKTDGAIYVSHGIDESGSLILVDEKGDVFQVNTGEIRFID